LEDDDLLYRSIDNLEISFTHFDHSYDCFPFLLISLSKR